MARSQRLLILLLCFLTLSQAGCGWRDGGGVELRNAPYPFDACIAIDDGGNPDALSHRGVAFVWSGLQVGTVGQDAMCSLVDRARQLWESILYLSVRREWRARSFFSNRLVEPNSSVGSSTGRPLVDGLSTYAFKICTGRIPMADAGVPADVAVQMAEAVVYELRAKGGLSIMGAAPGNNGERRSAMLQEPVLRFMESEQDSGRLCLMTLGRLLAYDFVRRHLDWSAGQADGIVTISIDGVDDGNGISWVPTEQELAGITFYTPDSERTQVFLDGRRISNLSLNDRDSTRRESVTILGNIEAEREDR